MTTLARSPPPPPKASEPAFQGVLWGGFAIAVVFFAFRVYVRIKSFKRLYVDDGLVFFALLILLVNAIVWQYAKQGLYTLLNVQAGLKPPPADMAQQVEQYLRLSGAVIVMFYTSLWAVKLSFLIFFKRLGQNVRSQKLIWWSVTVLVVLGYVACLSTIQWWCLLPSFATLVVKCATPSAIDFQRATLIANCVIDIFTDILVMVIPLHMLWKVQISLRQKIMLGGIFSLTVFIIVIAIVRVGVLLNSSPGSADGSWLYLWSSVEQTISMVIACLAAVRALFARQLTPRYSPGPRSGRKPLNPPAASEWRTSTTWEGDGTKRSGESSSSAHGKSSIRLQEQPKGSSIPDDSSQEHISALEADGRRAPHDAV